MKKTVLMLTVLGSFLLANQAFAAGYIKEGAVACLSLKNIKTYFQALESEAPVLAEDLIQRADCFIKQRPVNAVYLEDSTDFVTVKTYEGFTVWLKKEDFIKAPK